MFKLGRIWVLLAVMALASCAAFRDRPTLIEDDDTCCDEPAETYDVPKPEVASSFVRPDTLSGLKYCPNTRQCSDDALMPPQPCVQPMPTYYDDVSVLEEDEGIVLIHPFTRDKIICYEDASADAEACVERFLAAGYVLITDVPQFVGKQDILQDGTYPTRKWRKGETVPRW